ncbi:hypothetical protein Nepgr_005192 [Nepenthes gracilis]|uniref:phosphatidylglycerophosphatase n=1 Tax=Nepenthes gracilis TaxID=150966 RepID=A0AAD3S2U5_NEPGR|nr:hypothetical protein Nepgr_005192 [Nepenthes gracilis]
MKVSEHVDDPGEREKTNSKPRKIVKTKADAKKVLVGAGARILFYPTLLYNVVRNKIQSEFRWWDQVDQFLLLGAVPFSKDVPRLKQLGVGGVITLSEPFETLVPPSLYQAYGIDHLVIPTRDYQYAPSLIDIDTALDFIHRNASSGRTTYVHCKAGRGRSPTIVICYLVKYKHMTPAAALELIRSKRPRVLLHPSQEKAVQEYYTRGLEISQEFPPSSDTVLVTESHIDGYDDICDVGIRKDEEIVPKAENVGLPKKSKLSNLLASLSHVSRWVSTDGIARKIAKQPTTDDAARAARAVGLFNSNKRLSKKLKLEKNEISYMQEVSLPSLLTVISWKSLANNGSAKALTEPTRL